MENETWLRATVYGSCDPFEVVRRTEHSIWYIRRGRTQQERIKTEHHQWFPTLEGGQAYVEHHKVLNLAKRRLERQRQAGPTLYGVLVAILRTPGISLTDDLQFAAENAILTADRG